MGQKRKGMGHNSTPVIGERLRSFIERVERLETEKAAITDDIKEVLSEAKGVGLCTKTIKRIIRDRKLGADKVQEEQIMLEIYKAALGELHDTPLGEAARRHLSPPPSEESPEPKPEEVVLPEVDVEGARTLGTEAAKDKKLVTENPFPARDPRRAAWDEAWCAASGSDGMEIPEAWRRKKKEKPEKKGDDGNDEGGEE